MGNRWVLSMHSGYGPNTPYSIQREGARLKELLAIHCRGPYDENGIKMRFDAIVEGKSGDPNSRIGIKTYPFAKNLLCAEINISKAEWEVSLDAYRRFLWLNVDKAIRICVDKLKKKKIQFDAEKLRQHLALVEANFLGEDAKTAVPDVALRGEPMSIDVQAEDEQKRIVVQYQRDDRNDPWDFDRKVLFENLLNESLSSGDLGFCDCVDFDYGTINAICSVSNAEAATKAIIKTLRANGRLNGAVIEETVNGQRKVVWPTDFVGGIEYI